MGLDPTTIEWENVEIDAEAFNKLTVKEFKTVLRAFPDLDLSDPDALDQATQLEGIQALVWANFKGQGMTIEDTEGISLEVLGSIASAIAGKVEDEEPEAVEMEASLSVAPKG